ncbi:hypothetical protein [Escherichia coli ISC7]|uniref:Uncharacterized protein n=1 Tax=Escherichia coli ISC7 TaxID=1432555 RepID=W1EUB4_ECOLX|nr:hypothetical protein [Escherichia coli ISC7]
MQAIDSDTVNKRELLNKFCKMYWRVRTAFGTFRATARRLFIGNENN